MLGLELGFGGLFLGVPFGLAGLGFALIFRTAKELNFAFGVTIAIGGYATYSIFNAGLPLAVAIILSVIFCGLLGGALRFFFFGRLRDHNAVLLFSFGLNLILQNVLLLVYGAHEVVIDAPGLNSVVDVVPGTNLTATVVQILGLVILVVVWLFVWWMLARTKVGLGMTAVIRDAEVSELVGVNAKRMKILAYVMGSALAGVAGALTAVSTGVGPSLGFQLLLYGFIATLLAGQQLAHAALWGVALGVVLNLSAVWLPAQYQTVVVFALLVIYLVFRMMRMPRFAL